MRHQFSAFSVHDVNVQIFVTVLIFAHITLRAKFKSLQTFHVLRYLIYLHLALFQWPTALELSVNKSDIALAGRWGEITYIDCIL